MKLTRHGTEYWTLTDELTGRVLGLRRRELSRLTVRFEVTGDGYQPTEHKSFIEAHDAAERWLMDDLVQSAE